MHYVDFDSKTKQTIVRLATYGAVGIAALIISLVIIFAARGYDVDPSTGQVIRNGLLLVWSQPESADLYLGGELETDTPARLPLPVGAYDLKLSREGYRDWSKTVPVNESEVVKLNYPRLYPNDIRAENFGSLPGADYWSQSPSQEILLVHSKANPRTIQFYNAEDTSQPVRAITIPDGKLTLPGGVVGSIEPYQWSADSEFLLVRHIGQGVNETLRIEVDTETIVNINDIFPVGVTDVQFDRSENDILYGVSAGGQLRQLDIKKKSAATPLAAEVAEYRVASDGRVAITQLRQKETHVLLYDEKDGIRVLMSGPKTGSTQIELGEYDGDGYAVVSINPNKAQIVWLDQKENREDDIAATFSSKGIRVHPVSFSGKYSLVSSSSGFIVHDFNKLRVFPFKIKNIDLDTISWFDDGHIAGVAAGKIVISEYDGDNQTQVGDAANFKIYAEKGYDTFFSISQNKNKLFSLDQSNLILLN